MIIGCPNKALEASVSNLQVQLGYTYRCMSKIHRCLKSVSMRYKKAASAERSQAPSPHTTTFDTFFKLHEAYMHSQHFHFQFAHFSSLNCTMLPNMYTTYAVKQPNRNSKLFAKTRPTLLVSVNSSTIMCSPQWSRRSVPCADEPVRDSTHAHTNKNTEREREREGGELEN